VKYGAFEWLAASLPDKSATCIHCRIAPIEKLKTLVALERRKPPITFVE
jgi:hypothetical protein